MMNETNFTPGPGHYKIKDSSVSRWTVFKESTPHDLKHLNVTMHSNFRPKPNFFPHDEQKQILTSVISQE